jgi:hypothetical protein
MSYRRKVHCRYCYGTGHNVRSCEKMREDAKANPAGYAARKVSQYATSKSEGGSARSCSYCRDSGHNRKSCTKLVQDYAQMIRKNAEYRKNVLERMVSCGLGIGALVSCRYNDSPLSLITEIEWDSINTNGSFSNAGCVKIDSDSYTKYNITLDKFDIVNNSYRDYYWNLESGIDPEMVKAQMPSDWLSGKANAIDEYFGLKR